MLAVLCAAHEPTAEVLAVEEPFRVPLIDPETGELLGGRSPRVILGTGSPGAGARARGVGTSERKVL